MIKLYIIRFGKRPKTESERLISIDRIKFSRHKFGRIPQSLDSFPHNYIPDSMLVTIDTVDNDEVTSSI